MSSCHGGQSDDGIVAQGRDGFQGHVAGALGGHSSFCLTKMVPTRRMMASSLGKMPTTSVRRWICSRP